MTHHEIVYLLVDRNGVPKTAAVNRAAARRIARAARLTVIRCEVVKTKRPNGGA
jgi:hypothetical protein